MSKYEERIAALTPEERTRLEKRLRPRSTARSAHAIPRRDTSEPAPVSYAQERLLFLDELEPGRAVYNVATAIRLVGRLDEDFLERSLEEVVQRHEVLRTTFDPRPTPARQVVSTAPGSALTRVALTLDPSERESGLRELLAREAQTPFDLAKGRLVRGLLVCLGGEEHVLALTLHHAVCDAWSLGILLSDLWKLYRSHVEGRAAGLVELPIQYGDFAVWQREWLQGGTLERQLAFWRGQLDGAPSRVTLPADYPRPKLQSFEGAHENFHLPGELVQSLKTLGRGEDATLHMVLMAAFMALLARYTGEQDLVIGSAVAGRTRPEVEALVGPFANTLPIRLDASGDPSFCELVGRVRSVLLDAYSHQDVPFEKLVAELLPERDPGINPLFQVVLSLQLTPSAGATSGGDGAPAGLELSRVNVESRRAHLDLAMTLAETPEGIVGALEYNTDLYERSTIQRALGHYERLLSSASASGRVPLSELPMLDEEELRALDRSSGADRSLRVPIEANLASLFESELARGRARVAVVSDAETLTYGELDERANAVAHELSKRGVRSGEVVGVLMPRSSSVLVSLLGIVKAGGAYLALDGEYPRERLSYLLRDSGARFVLTERDSWTGHSYLEQSGSPVFTDALGAESAGPARESGADDLAYVTYTSGSTGEPKGVAVTHRGVVRLVKGVTYATLGEECRVLQMAPVTFDASTFEIWGALLNGGRVVMYPERVASASELEVALDRHGVTTLWLTSGLFNALVDERPSCFARVREVVAGGEALSLPHVRRAQQACAETTFVNGYGPTEGTTFTCCHRIPRDTTRRYAVPIGTPLAGTRVYVLDRHGSRAPLGATGELYIGGEGVARGYLGRAALTAARFVPDPFSGSPGARMYRTGDLARVLADGSLDYVGRTDDQLKIRGYRVEPGEVESVLAAHADVRDCAVVAVENAQGQRQLIGYVVPASTPGATVDALRTYLSERLPEYMIPQLLVELPELPLTRNGKLDQAALPAPADSAAPAPSSRTGSSLGPRNPIEEALAEIWKELLSLEQVGVNDNFFELGGHSLMAMRMMTRAREVFRVELPLRRAFELPTIAGLSRGVEEAARDGSVRTVPVLTLVGEREAFPLSFAQQRLWLLDQLAGASPAYHVSTALRMEGALDRDALGRSLDAIVARHEALRTHFVVEGDTPVQKVVRSARVALPVVDFTPLGETSRQAGARRTLRERARQTFDLSTGPLLRLLLVRLGTEEHILQVTMHHIVSDAWSVGLFMRELGALYAAFTEGNGSPLPPLAVQYPDYAAWQRAWLRDETLEELLSYWRRVLPPGLEGTEIPHDHPRPTVPGFKGGRTTRAMTPELSRAIRETSRAEGATLFMVLLAGFQILLHRHTGREDVVVGTPTANRGVSAAENLIGFFANSLVLRTELGGEPSFREVLSRVREVALGAYAHQDVPFEKVVEAVSPERDKARNPLFQIGFALQSVAIDPPRLPGLTLSGAGSSAEATRFDLEVHLWDRPEGLRIVATYDAELFEPETIDRLLGHYVTLMEAGVSAPARKISELPMLEDAERRFLLEETNATAHEYPRDARIEEIFAERVRSAPEAVAVVFGAERRSYAELDRLAESLASRLRESGVGPESLVGVLGERSFELYAAVLAVLKAGGAYVPLDPSYPEERLAFMVDDAAVTALLVERSSAELAPRRDVPIVFWDESGDPEAPPSVGVTRTRAGGAGNLAYVIYTSGSTGVPKGVAVTHRAVLRLVSSPDYAAIGPGDRVAQAGSFSFDAATFELWGALVSGAAVVGIEKNIALSPEEFGRELTVNRVSVLFLTTALYNVMVREAGSSLAAVGTVLFGGEAVDAASVRFCLSHDRPSRLVHVYGPTESTTFASYADVTEVPEGASTVPIGGPIVNTTLYVLDPSGELCPIGAPGELHVGGEGLARGYWNRPALTAERFVPHPFGPPGARLYRTGDVARWRADGELEYVGRIDNQVKLRGFRVELGEVEAVLREDERVRDAVVVLRTDAGEDKRLVAYVVLEESGSVSPPELRRSIASRLPEYMVPQAVVELGSLPLTANGKVNRDALPSPERLDGLASEDVAVARGPVEEGLAEIFREVLGVGPVGVHDDFFDLGGHSLVATQLVSRVKKAFRVELKLRQFFDEPTIAGLAARIAAHHRAGRLADPPVLRRLSTGDDRLLSFAQQRLWFLAELDPESTAYTIPATFRLEGRLDAAALEWSFRRVVARHEALRTVFAKVEGRAVQRILELAAATPMLPVIDLSALGRSAREAEARRLAADEARRVFDLSRGPLLRARLVRLESAEHQLMLSTHHIVSDGWSQGVLYRELDALYRARLENRPAHLEPLPIQYADYAGWQRAWFTEKVLDEQLEYWRRQLQDVSVLELPTDRPRPAVQTFEGRWESVSLSAELRQALSELGRREGVTFFMLLLASFQTLLHRYSGQDDVVVGTPVANRTRDEVESLIGFFANNLVMRGDFSGRPTFREVLARARDTALDAYAHQELPFEKLVDELSPERSLSRTPLFQVVFALHSGLGGGLTLEGLTTKPQESRIRSTRFDLELYLWDRPQGMTAVMFYNTDLYEGETIRRMLGHFRNLLLAVTRQPDTPVVELPVLGPEERDRLLAWSRAGDIPHDASHASIASAFETQAAKFKDRPAVTMPATDGAPRRELSYGELEASANRLSHYLIEKGVGSEVLVGLCLGRTPELVTAILGVLKAGGAYVPLDPDYPEDRLQMMIEDAGTTLVVTESAHAEPFRHAGVETVLLDGVEDERALARQSSVAPPRVAEPEPDHLAYVIYTSGSSGRPKGVGVTQANVLRLFSATSTWFRFDEQDVFTLFHSYAFDFSVWELFGALLHGGRVVVVPHWLSRDPSAFLELLRRERVTVLSQTPSAFRGLARADDAASLAASVEEEQKQEQELELALRVVVFGGEALEPRSLAPWLRRRPVRPVLVNMYGITETTVHVTYRPIAAPEVAGGIGSLLGRPIPDLACYLLDENLEPVPRGVRGQIYVSGRGLARGYLGRPELTTERFLPNPYASDPGDRLYRTGDLGRYLADGDIEYLGRADDQVKLRGFRIELGEIETALASHDNVVEAVVRLDREEDESRRLVAYVVPASAPGDALVLREHLSRRLPEYMVPSSIVFLEAFPLTANGKLDVTRLPSPQSSPREPGTTRQAGPVEAILVDVWKDVLRISDVGLDENFFELGGDSILSIQVVAKAAERGVSLTVRDLFQHQSIAALARVAGEARSIHAEQGLVTGPSPLTPVQAWFLEGVTADPHHYNQSMLLELPVGFRGELLHDVLSTLLTHHDALRLRFRRDAGEGGEWRQEHDGGASPECIRVDMSELDEADRGAAIQSAAGQAQRSLDLAEGPTARWVWLDTGLESKGRLLWVVHHLAIDGVSWRILLDDFERGYRQRERGDEVALGAKTTSYGSWAEHLVTHSRSEESSKELQHWIDTLDTSIALPLDAVPPRVGANTEASVARVVGRLSEAETRALLRELPARFRTEVNDVLLTALLVAVHRWTGLHELVLTLEGHGREDLFDDVDLTRTVGWFTSLFPIRLRKPESGDLVTVLHSVQAQLSRIPRKGIGYGLLRYVSRRAELLSKDHPAMSFNYLGQFDQTLGRDTFFRTAPESVGAVRSPRGERRHLIDVTAVVSEGRLMVDWMFNRSLHEKSTVQSLSDGFLESLVELASARDSGPDYSTEDFSLAKIDQDKLDKLLSKKLGAKK